LRRDDDGVAGYPGVVRPDHDDAKHGDQANMHSPIAPGPTEKQLLLSDRIASMGLLAAAVVHELNNPLGYTIANVGFALEELRRLETDLVSGDGEGAAEMASRLARARAGVHAIVDALLEARQGGDRARLFVRELKTFSRVEDERGEPLEVRRVLEAAINIAYGEIRYRARLVKDYEATPLVDGNAAHLGQVFLNLLVNAAQAIREGDAQHQCIRVVTRTDAQGRCVVEVTDTGKGILPENLSRIFDPFFTTKNGRGAGLGLSICQNVVRAMGGELAVHSRIAEGATFRVTLPAAVEAVRRPPAVSTRIPAEGSRRCCILVIDDEPMMARAVRRLIGGEHEVAATSDPVDAVEQVRKGARYDAILCDLMMPMMSGMDVYDAIARVDAAQARRMVFMTGGAFTPRAVQFLEAVDNPRIEKPLEHAALRAILRSQLTDRSER
jgi:CheY-like chemotaxis protein/two-component sensor histidine kinase